MNQTIAFSRPPAPPRETARTRQTLSVRVDAGLARAFYDTCERLGIRHSEMMEIILWNALDRPTMSFEQGFVPRLKKTKLAKGDGE